MLSDKLTTNHPTSSYGNPVLVLSTGVYGPADCPVIIDEADAVNLDLVKKWNVAVAQSKTMLGVGTLDWWRAMDAARIERGEKTDIFGNAYLTESIFAD